ncbi:hypothetical protein BH09GEM1_BH09GEM1_29740 [soil metagenome]
MPRSKKPDLTLLVNAPSDAATRGVRVFTPKDVGDVVRVAREKTLGRQVDATRRLGVSRTMLSGLERGEGGSQLDLTLRILTDLGFDVVLVPRDPSHSVRGDDA